MSKPTRDDRLSNIHQEALTQFNDIQTTLRDERLQCLQDRRFYSLAGAQWEGPLWDQWERRPKLEVNKIHLSVIRIINDYRNNRITVNFVSKDGSKTDKLAETCDGLYRADEKDSVANEAYDNGFEEAVGGGFGAWRLRASYEDEEDGDDDRQRICIDPIFDADSSVYFDLNAKRQDKADADHAFLVCSMTHDAFKSEWGQDPASWPKIVQDTQFDWCTPDVVYIAEYFKVEKKTETIRVFKNILGEEEKYSQFDFDKDEELEKKLIAQGSREIRRKKIKTRKIHKYIMSGGGILEDCGYIAGKCIPIIPVYGKRWFIDNVERCMGHVRLAKDAQRLKNMQVSKLAEISALSSVEKPIVTPEQMTGHQLMWEQDNIKNYPYLLLNPITNTDGSQTISGPVAYTHSANIPPSLAALLQITEQDIQEILGNNQGGEKIVSNISGKAVELIQQRLDMQTFIYMSNFAKAMKRCGEVWLSMAKELYVEDDRKMKIVTEDDKTDSVTLMKPMIDKKTGEQIYENDLSNAKFDVDVDVGPSSVSRKAAIVQALTGMMQISQQDPDTMQVLSAMAMMNMEGEGVDDVRAYFRQRLIRMGVVQPTDQEIEQLQKEEAAKKPDANTVYLESAAEAEQAKAASSRAQTIKTIADAELSKAKTAETLAKTTETNQNVVLTSITANQEAVLGKQIQPVVR